MGFIIRTHKYLSPKTDVDSSNVYEVHCVAQVEGEEVLC